MKIKDLTPDLFDDGIPTYIEGNLSIEKIQRLKPAYMRKGIVNQVLFCNDEIVEKVVIGGYYDGKCYCEEFMIKNESFEEKALAMCTGNKRGELPPDFPRPSEEELDEFRDYIDRHTWKIAKTFENFSPHQYIINYPCWKNKEDGRCSGFCKSCKKEREEFERWAKFIRKYGERQKMLKTVYTVFCLDERQYWTMGDPMLTTWVLNRALIDDPKRVPKLYWLDRT